MANRARLWRIVFAVVGWFALGLQYGLLVTTNPDRTTGELTLNFFSYFTVLTNILAAVALTVPVLIPTRSLGRLVGSEGFRGAVAMYIAVVGLIYHFLLSQVWDPQGWSLVANSLLHYVMPIAFVLDWLLFTPKGRLRWIDGVKWLSFPLVYGVWCLVHGALNGWYPYWFIDIGALGWGPALINFSGLLVFFLLLGFVVVAIDRTLGRKARRDRITPAA